MSIGTELRPQHTLTHTHTHAHNIMEFMMYFSYFGMIHFQTHVIGSFTALGIASRLPVL